MSRAAGCHYTKHKYPMMVWWSEHIQGGSYR